MNRKTDPYLDDDSYLEEEEEQIEIEERTDVKRSKSRYRVEDYLERKRYRDEYGEDIDPSDLN